MNGSKSRIWPFYSDTSKLHVSDKGLFWKLKSHLPLNARIKAVYFNKSCNFMQSFYNLYKNPCAQRHLNFRITASCKTRLYDSREWSRGLLRLYSWGRISDWTVYFLQRLSYSQFVSLCIYWNWAGLQPPCDQSQCHAPGERWKAVCRHTFSYCNHPEPCHLESKETKNNSAYVVPCRLLSSTEVPHHILQ